MLWPQYLTELSNRAAKLRGTDLGVFWADQVVTAPDNDDTDGWEALDVRLTHAVDPHTRLVLEAVDTVVRNKETAEGFVARLRENDEAVTAKIPGRLRAHVAASTLSSPYVTPTVKVSVAGWALAGITDPTEREQVVARVTGLARESEVADLLAVTRRLDSSELAEALTARVAEKLDAARHAETERVAAAAAATAMWERAAHIAADPAAAFAGYATEHGLTVENVAEFDLVALPQLLEAAGKLVDTVATGLVDELDPLVRAVLETAVTQRVGGASFHDSSQLADHAIDAYQRVPLRTAASEGEFWRELAQLRRDQSISGDDARVWYINWRQRYIRRELATRTAAQLAAGGAGTEPPPDCDRLTVTVETAHVRYAGIEELFAAMRSYFLPGPGTSHPQLADGEFQSAGVDLDIDSASRSVEQLEDQIRAWHDSPDPDPYVDPAGRSSRSLRDDEPAWLHDHRVVVNRAPDGGVTLRLSAPNDTEFGVALLNKFAAYTGEAVTYDGRIRLAYHVRPPLGLGRLPLRRLSEDAGHEVVGLVALPLPLAGIVDHLQSITGCDTAAATRISEALTAASRHDATGGPHTVDAGDVTVQTDEYGYRLGGGEIGGSLVSMQKVRESRYDSEVTIGLPVVGVSLRHQDPERHTELAATLLAVASRHIGEPHPDGFHDRGTGNFVLDDDVAAELLSQPPTPPPPSRPVTPPGPRTPGPPAVNLRHPDRHTGIGK